MSAFFPRLFPGELLYSAVARYRDTAGFPSERAAIRSAFGTSTGAAVVGLPGRITSFLAQLPPGHGLTADRLLQDHTTFPYYEKFQPPGRASDARRALCGPDASEGISGSGGARAYGLLGLRASTVKAPNRLRYCPACAAEECAALGTPYWHRACQLPGVLLCPTCHGPLRQSATRVTTREAVHCFTSLSVALRAASFPVRALLPAGASEKRTEGILSALADGTAWLLRSRVPPMGLPALQEQYHALLSRAGLLTPGGRVRVSRLRRALVAFYGPAFLRGVGCPLCAGGDQPGDWLARLIRKPRTSHHPLRHLLLMTCLGVSPKGFFGEGSQDLTPSQGAGPAPLEGKHPAPCPNLLCRSVLPEIKPHPLPTTCKACGFCFRKAGGSGARRVVLSYGSIWESELKRLVTEGSESLRGVARALGVDPRTVQRHARRLGVWRPAWTTWDRSAPAGKRKAAARRTLLRHRAAWQALQEAHLGESTQQLRRRAPATYAHLYRYDRSWLRSHQPARRQPDRRQPRARSPRVDWPSRDRELRKEVEKAVADLLDASGRPIRITRTAVARRAGSLARVLQHPGKLPLTLAYLETVAESRLGFARRRIRHAAGAFAAEGVCPPRWVFLRRAGLRKDLASQLDPEVRKALQRLKQHAGPLQDGQAARG